MGQKRSLKKKFLGKTQEGSGEQGYCEKKCSGTRVVHVLMVHEAALPGIYFFTGGV